MLHGKHDCQEKTRISQHMDHHRRDGGHCGDPQLDRSPCGTGTSAKQALLHSLGELDVDVPFTYESFISTKFIGRILKETKVGDYDAVIPTVKGAAYLCGEATWFCDPEDPMTKGFVVPQ